MKDEFISDEFFVVRTPLLPRDAFARWSGELEAPRLADAPLADLQAGLARDRQGLRERLASIVRDPVIREALLVASRDLQTGLRAWQDSPDTKKGRGAERSLVRYFTRMSTRCTPFGLFAGVSTGRIGDSTRIELCARDRYARHTRLDLGFVEALARRFQDYPDVRRRVRVRTNPTLYRCADRLRYVEASTSAGSRSHHLVSLLSDAHLDRILASARSPHLIDDLARLLTPEVSEAEAFEFVAELVHNGVLLSELQPVLTGEDAALELQRTLTSLNAVGAESLAELRAGMREVDEAGLGSAHGVPLEEAVTLLTEEPPDDLLQVHLTKPVVEAQLDRGVTEEVLRGLTAMNRLFGQGPRPWAEQFARGFAERYGDREVPLLEVLDEDIGLGFEPGGVESSEPLVAGLTVHGEQAGDRSDPTWAAFTARVCQALHSGARAVELHMEDLPEDPRRLPLPDSFAVMATVIGDPAVERGEYLLHFKNAAGPSGIKLLARFCCDDPELTEHVRRHAAAEERLRPDAIFAEIVHAPEGHTSNVLQRPLLRGFEIPILGRSGSRDEATIPLTDLTASVDANGRIRLRSLTHAREVEPRLSSAHNYTWNSIPVYRFLCMLQNQGTCAYLAWSWRNLSAAAFLPRVSCGRVVLTPARWRLDSRDVARLTRQEGAAAFRLLQDVRRERGIPRWVVLLEHDNELLVDLENVLSVESFLHSLRGRQEQELFELLAPFGTDFVRGPEGGFAHEIIIPFLRRSAVGAAPAPRRSAGSSVVRRVFPPGSEWLYLKVFASGPLQDRLLTESLGPAVRRLVEERIAEEWFFARLGATISGSACGAIPRRSWGEPCRCWRARSRARSQGGPICAGASRRTIGSSSVMAARASSS